MWKQNFPFDEKCVCYIRGYYRAFYQGSTDHRGIPSRPGRVVTILPHPEQVVWGLAFRVPPGKEEEVLELLDVREKGGYDRVELSAFHPVHHHVLLPSVICYIANETNEEYLGEATEEHIAMQILSCRGPSGPNREYLFLLAEALRSIGAKDNHVFEIEGIARRLIEMRADTLVPSSSEVS